MSLAEKQRLRGALVAALERANEASRELNRARELNDAARIRLAMTTHSAAEDEITKIKRRQAELEHGLA
jgi:hypothetical protein